MLTSGKPYVEEDKDLTARKKMTMDKHAMKAAAFSEQELLDITELLCTKTEILNRIRSKTNRKNKSRGSEGFHGSDSKYQGQFNMIKSVINSNASRYFQTVK